MRLHYFVAILAFLFSVQAIPLTLLKAKERELLAADQLLSNSLRGNVQYETHWFDQILDHYDITPCVTNSTWKQRFWVNKQFWSGAESGAPVFFFIEGEGAGSPRNVISGNHFDLARQYNGLLVSLEHRYYGASLPTDMTTKNLRFLSSHQALSDLAYFITTHLVPTYGLNLGKNAQGYTPPGPVNKIVAFGGSYPGNLAAWARIRFPQLIYLAVSSSAPVEAKLSFTGYNDVVYRAYSDPVVGGSPSCASHLRYLFSIVDEVFDSPARDAAAEKLQSCGPLTGEKDVAWAAENMAGMFMGVVQYNRVNVGTDIKSVCQTLLNGKSTGKQPIENLADAIRLIVGPECVDNSYQNFVDFMTETDPVPTDSGVGYRQWIWQTCTEFGYYQTCYDGTDCPFSRSITVEYTAGQCADYFGPKYTQSVAQRRVDASNAYYGGKGIEMRAGRIIHVNGNIDPWSHLAIIKSENPLSPAIYINGTAHCAEMRSPHASDLPSLTAARRKLAQHVDDLLGM